MPALQVRVTDEQAQQIKANAKASGKSLSAFLRAVALEPAPRVAVSDRREVVRPSRGLDAAPGEAEVRDRPSELSENEDELARVDPILKEPPVAWPSCPVPSCDFSAPSDLAVCPSHGVKVR